ncbi:MAG: glycoside hydrolase, partial [Bacteroidales bacterium]|nr:glycoside hydrolase [Bacteroidales bacterium]
MKKIYFLIGFAVVALVLINLNWAGSSEELRLKEKRNELVTSWIDNNGYWIKMAEQGLAELNPEMTPAPAIYTGSRILANSVRTMDSPDVPVTNENSTQSENSVFVDPRQPDTLLNSNNSTSLPGGSITLYGANDFFSFDAAETWGGEIAGAGGPNSGDPSTAISLSGRWYVGYISSGGGQGVSYSDDQGESWTSKLVASAGGGLLDKNHMWIDNSSSSPYEGSLYNAWTPFNAIYDSEIALSYSHDEGESWSAPINVSAAVNAGSHNQGVNLSTGPNGEVYAVWAIYDSWPMDENAIGFARSFDGGETWEDATRIIEDIRGIRNTTTSKNMRVNSFPVAAVDISNGPNSGNIYVVWTNIGIPGVNSGSDKDVYVIKSSDQGETWSEPIRVNQDPAGLGKEHYFPWITCDPANGALSVIFYDDRNVNSTQCEVFCANSYDAGETWEDFKVSDVAFTPSPISGLASGYFGDYLGISANDGWVYPVWTDNRSGTAMSYTSPYQTNPLPTPYDLEGFVTFESGESTLNWNFEGGEGFEHFIIYRDSIEVGTSTETQFTESLPDYGIYQYGVTAFYGEDGESIMAGTSVQWGDAHIGVNPAGINATLKPGDSSIHYITIHNVGELELEYDISPFIQSRGRDIQEYCEAGAATYDDEYIQRVVVGDIDNSSGSESSGYQDFTDLSTLMSVGSTYEMEVTNGSTQWAQDECGIWIDWNRNEDFTDDEPIIVNGTPGVGPYTASIETPSGAVGGETRMRIRITYSKTPEPCGIDSYGEVEDYTIMVSNWLQIDNYGGAVAAGDSIVIGVQLDAGTLDIGNYYAELNIAHNDPEQPELIVPIHLGVTDLEANTGFANDTTGAKTDTICAHASVELHFGTAGGHGDLMYQWSSIPEGYSSQDTLPVFENITERTLFIATVSDSIGMTHDTLEVIVLDVPLV